ncbi:MAG: putative peptidoglycan glycosyltransferase FtsW [Clostridia bacterium]
MALFSKKTQNSIKSLLGFSETEKIPQRKPAKKNEEAHFIENMRFRLFDLGVGMDMPLLIIVLALVGIGLVVLFSASFAQAYYYLDDSYYYINRQIIFAVAGVIAMLLISTLDYHLFYRFNNLIFLITVFLLLIVLVLPSFSASEGDAVRWISIGELSFQPSEVAKFSLVIMLATIIVKSGDKIAYFAGGTFKCFVMTGLIAGLVVAQKHVSGTLIILALAVIVMFVGGVKTRYFVILGSLAIPVLIYLVFFSDSFAYALLRIQGWIDPFNPPDGVDTYQTVQSIYAIGAGQLFGVGLGQSTQKYMYLPQSRNDFIFPIAAEELGFVGAMIIILLFMALIWRGVVISMNAKDKFGTLLGMGMTFTVGIQAALNICVVTNAIPNTGISLPFFSYGGTSIMMLLGEMGVLLAVSRNSYMQKT